MSREEKINKMIEEIKIRRNDEQYSGGPFPIYHIEFDILNEEIERLNNKINSIFSNFEQFINSYKNDILDDFFIGLRLSEVVEFYNDLKEVISNE